MSFRNMRVIIPATLVLVIGAVVVLGDPAIRGSQGSDEPAPIPDHVAGYEVLDVQTRDNTTCYSIDVPTVILKSTEATYQDALSSDSLDMGAIEKGLRDKGFPEGTRIGIAGPGSSKEEALEARTKWNRLRREKWLRPFRRIPKPDSGCREGMGRCIPTGAVSVRIRLEISRDSRAVH